MISLVNNINFEELKTKAEEAIEKANARMEEDGEESNKDYDYSEEDDDAEKSNKDEDIPQLTIADLSNSGKRVKNLKKKKTLVYYNWM